MMSEFRTVADIFRFAVAREEEAAASYAALAEGAPTRGLRDMLLELQADEEDHKRRLEGLAFATAAGAPLPGPRIVEELRLTDAVPDLPLTAEATLQDLLIHAAHKEARAAALYAGLAAGAADPASRALFELLAAQERVHKLRLETAYERYVLSED
jgi:rubrerythrin